MLTSSTSIEITEALYPNNTKFLTSTNHQFETIQIEGQSYIKLDSMTSSQTKAFIELLRECRQTTFFPVETIFADGTTISINVDSTSLYTVKNAKKQIEKQHGTPSGQMQVFIKRAYQYIPISAELTTLESVESLSDNENKDREEYENNYRFIEAKNNTIIQQGDELHVQHMLSNNRTFATDDDVVVLDIYHKNDSLKAQWRKAKVIYMYSECLIKIHYYGWETCYDFTLDLSLDVHKRRISHEYILEEHQQIISKFTRTGVNGEVKKASQISTVEALLLSDEQL